MLTLTCVVTNNTMRLRSENVTIKRNFNAISEKKKRQLLLRKTLKVLPVGAEFFFFFKSGHI